MRLKYIQVGDFRNGNWKLRDIWEAERQQNGWLPLKAGEVALLVSMTGEQLLFLPALIDLDNGQLVLDTRRLQLRGTSWNPLRIKEYAEKARIELQGFKSFGEYYEKSREQKAQKRRRK